MVVEFLTRGVGFERGLADRLGERLAGLGPERCVEVLLQVIRSGKLDGAASLPLMVPAEAGRDELERAVEVAKSAVEKGTLPSFEALTGEDLESAREVLGLAAFVGVRFDLQPISAALRKDVKPTTRLLDRLGSVVEDLEGDGEYQFRNVTDIEGLKRQGCVNPDDGPRLSQSVRDDLVALVDVYAERLEGTEGCRGRSVGIIFKLASSALAGKVPVAKLVGSVTAAAAALEALVGPSLSGAVFMEEHLEELLKCQDWALDTRCVLCTALLRLEDRGLRTFQALPAERALEALRRIEHEGREATGRSADELRLEVARRCAAHVVSPHGPAARWMTAEADAAGKSPLSMVEDMLDRLVRSEGSDRDVVSRARYWRATLRYRIGRQDKNPSAKLVGVEAAAAELRASILEFREDGDTTSLLYALQTQIEVIGTLIDILPGDGDAEEWRGLLREGQSSGAEAQQLAVDMGLHRVHRSIDGAVGRLNQAVAKRCWESSQRDAGIEFFGQAYECFERNFRASCEAEDRPGMVLMPSSLVLCSYAVGDVASAREWCDEYRRQLSEVRRADAVDLEPFLVIHRFVLDKVQGEAVDDTPLDGAWNDGRVRPMRQMLRVVYAPHLDELPD